MLRASGGDPKNPLVVAGLSEGNVERLKAGQPIKADFASFGVNLPGTLLILYGKTESEMEAMFRRHGLVDDATRVSVDAEQQRQDAVRAAHPRILIGLAGLPRSGKTTWARRQAYPIVCPDAIRYALHGQRYQQLAEGFVWATAKVMVRALFLAGHKHVILDATNGTAKRRAEWSDPEWATFWKHIDTPASVCLERARAENDQEIIPVIERMVAQWEPLDETAMRW